MKNKIIVLSLLLAGTCANINAQEAESNYYTKKWTDNIFVGAGVGVMGVFNDGMNSTFNFNISARVSAFSTLGEGGNGLSLVFNLIYCASVGCSPGV